MTIKDFFSGLLSKSNNSTAQGWNFILQSAGYNTRKNQVYYFGIIFSAVDAIGKAVQNTDYGLFKKVGDEWEEVEDHEAIKLLKTPNNIHSDRDFLYLMSSHIDLSGQAFLYPVRTKMSSKRIVELRMLVPSNVRTKESYENLIDGYEWIVGTKKVNFKPEDLINILRPDPTNPVQGLSTIGKARYEGDNELNSQELNASFYANGGLPSGVITTDNALEADVFKRLKMQIKRQYEGVSNAYKIMFLTHGMNYNSIQPTQRDMEYVAQRKLNRDQILAIFQVPKSVVAVSDQLNKSVSEVELRAFMSNTVEPRVKMIFEKLNRFYLPLFEGTEDMMFRYKSPVPEDKEFVLNEKIASVRRWRTPNEIRREEGLEDIEGGDTIDQPFSLNFTPIDDEEPKKSLKSTSLLEKKAENEQVKLLVQATHQENEHVHKIEELPKPGEQDNDDAENYTKRRNRYIQVKEYKFSLELNALFIDLAKSIARKPVKKSIEEDIENSPEMIFSKVMPEKDKMSQWKTLLYLLLLKNNTEIWQTATKQLSEVFKYNKVPVEGGIASLVSQRSQISSKSISDTLLKRIRDDIDNSIKEGDIDLRKIQKNIVNLVGDIKEWKAEQIARSELAWAYGEANHKTFLDNGVKQVKWVVGGGACKICEPNAGQIVDIGKTFPSGHTNEPAHINCRCMTLAI